MKTSVKNIVLFPLNLLYRISPKTTLKILFRTKSGYRLNLKNPTTFYEKIQWIKLNYKNPAITKLVDKYTVRSYIQEKAPELLTTLYWSGFNAKDIPWDILPQKFVIKVTHGSSFNIICKDKATLNKEKCVKQINRWLKEKYLRCYGEWFYGVEKPRIIIEEFLDTGTGKEPDDYKVFCFHGKAHFIIVDTDRYTNHKRNIYDRNWSLRKGVTINFPNDTPMPKPSELDQLLKYAELLSAEFPHVRVDLYIVKGKIYFGELTFTHGAGFGRISPREFDVELGELLKLEK